MSCVRISLIFSWKASPTFPARVTPSLGLHAASLILLLLQKPMAPDARRNARMKPMRRRFMRSKYVARKIRSREVSCDFRFAMTQRVGSGMLFQFVRAWPGFATIL